MLAEMTSVELVRILLFLKDVSLLSDLLADAKRYTTLAVTCFKAASRTKHCQP